MHGLKAIVSIIIFVIIFSNIIIAQSVRPVRDNIGYCWTPEEFEKLISYIRDNYYFESSLQSEEIVAGISPHDDYLYAANFYYPLFSRIEAQEIIIFGVTHRSARSELNDPQGILLLENFDKWKGLYEPVEISPLRERIISGIDSSLFTVSNTAHKLEHSIEGLLPFLQYFNRDIKITPIMVTAMSYERMDAISMQLARVIIDYMNETGLKLGKDIFFLISNDANHYGVDFENVYFGIDKEAHRKAVSLDKEIIGSCLSGKIDKSKLKQLSGRLWEDPELEVYKPLWCGRYPIVLGLNTLINIIKSQYNNDLNGELLLYSDTFTSGVIPLKGTNLGITAPFSLEHWVGFFSSVFYLSGD